jgi:hypothetical protein
VAARAIKQYDKNGDGALDAAELERCPGLKTLLKSPGDKVTAEQIAERLSKMMDARFPRMTVTCRVFLNEEPLEGAVVRLVPEQFMGDGYQPAVGTTNKNGTTVVKAEGPNEDVLCGYYRIEVSKKNSAGGETVPARYNTSTTLGCEVAPDMRGAVLVKLQGS